MKKLTILCDMDGIITDLLKKWLNRYNDDHGDDLTVADLKEPDIHKAVKPGVGTDMYDYIKEPGFFDDLEPIPGAIKTLTALGMEGHNVFIATAHADNPQCASAKIRWAQEHLGFSRKQVILIHAKHLLRGDVFIDDTPKKITAYKEAWPDSKVLTIAYPYNEDVAGVADLRAKDWSKPELAWDAMGQYIRDLAES
jgi:5'(3')-deoxyribonucleotidase